VQENQQNEAANPVVVRKSLLHGFGLFATRNLEAENLGIYSTRLVHGHQAEELLDRSQGRGGKRTCRDMVHCVDVPPGYEAQEESGDIQPPYVLKTDFSHPGKLCRLNQAPCASLANTTINRDGTVTAVSVAKGEELLTWYGASYGQSYDEVSADCVCVSCLDQMLGRNGPSRNRTRSSRSRTVLVRRYRLVEFQSL